MSNGLYEYAMPTPLEKNGAPGGYASHRKPRKLTWKYRHGVVQYRRPLNAREILDHRLIPLSVDDPYNLSLAKEELGDLIRFGEKIIPAASGPDFEIVYTDKKKFAAIRAGKDISPSQKQYTQVQDLADILWDFVSPKLQQNLLKEILPKF